jgi:hypothetical protein
MAGAVSLAAGWLGTTFPSQALADRLLVVGVAGGLGLVCYGAGVLVWRLEEVYLLAGLLRRIILVHKHG